jgi:hypothetical protein
MSPGLVVYPRKFFHLDDWKIIFVTFPQSLSFEPVVKMGISIGYRKEPDWPVLFFDFL